MGGKIMVLYMISMPFDAMRVFENAGFTLKELIIKEQHRLLDIGK